MIVMAFCHIDINKLIGTKYLMMHKTHEITLSRIAINNELAIDMGFLSAIAIYHAYGVSGGALLDAMNQYTSEGISDLTDNHMKNLIDCSHGSMVPHIRDHYKLC